MTYKWIKKPFLIAISFLAFGILFSCKGPNKPGGSDEKEFLITFKVSDKSVGSISATVDGTPITSGVTKVKKGKEVIFTLAIEKPNIYVLENWDGATQDTNNPLMAKLTVSKDEIVTAKVKKLDPDLVLSSLNMYERDVDISNLDDVKIDVENIVSTLDSNDVVAMFTYGTQTTPEQIKVDVDKANLDVGENIVTLSVQAVKGKYKAKEQKVKIIRKEKPQTTDAVPAEARLEAIEIAIVREKGGKAKLEEFQPLKDFKSDSAGPYEMQEAKTAYIELKAKVAKPASGDDFSVRVVNTTTYIDPAIFSRSADGSYFNKERITLSKGYNILEVRVKSPDKTKEGVYTVVVKYAGGPDPLALKPGKRSIIPGIYCPAQRKPLAGEVPDLVWMIAIAGW